MANDKNELIPKRTLTGWRVCMDYGKLNRYYHRGGYKYARQWKNKNRCHQKWNVYKRPNKYSDAGNNNARNEKKIITNVEEKDIGHVPIELINIQ